MKQILKLVLPLMLLTACEDTIDLDNRYSIASAPEIKRSVLVEEYTGVDCVNCPNGHTLLESLESYYNTDENRANGCELIVVGIHIQNYGKDVARNGFITPEAGNLTPEGVNPPQAQINRNGTVLYRQDWSKAIAEQICRTSDLSFPYGIEAVIEDSQVKVNLSMMADKEIPNARLHVWIVEDNITAQQKMPDGTKNADYVHKNVYRAFMTETYVGKTIKLDRNRVSTESFTYPVSEKWNSSNLRAIAFVETDSDGVLNAIQTNVVE